MGGVESEFQTEKKERLRLLEAFGQSESHGTPVVTAENPTTGEQYVIKMIALNKYNQIQLNEQFSILANLRRHRNVVKIHKVVRTKKFIYLITEKLNLRGLWIYFFFSFC